MHWTQFPPTTISFVMAEATALCELSLVGLSIQKKERKESRTSSIFGLEDIKSVLN